MDHKTSTTCWAAIAPSLRLLFIFAGTGRVFQASSSQLLLGQLHHQENLWEMLYGVGQAAARSNWSVTLEEQYRFQLVMATSQSRSPGRLEFVELTFMFKTSRFPLEVVSPASHHRVAADTERRQLGREVFGL
jgi:hypothetical protein